MADCSGYPQGCTWRKGSDQAIDPFGWGKPADEEYPSPVLSRIGSKPVGIGATVDHPCTAGRKSEFTRGIGRNGQEAIEQLWELAGPGATLETMISDDDVLTPNSGGYCRNTAGRAP